MRDQLFDHVDLDPDRIHIPDWNRPDGVGLRSLPRLRTPHHRIGGIDLQILGIGRTGHIGFNEPGSAADSITG